MNFGVLLCLTMFVLFLILAIVFTLLKEKSTVLIAGFNTLQKKQREKYDKSKISKDMRNVFLVWCLIFVVGGILSYAFSPYVAIITFVVWLILFLKKVWVAENSFDKYIK